MMPALNSMVNRAVIRMKRDPVTSRRESPYAMPTVTSRLASVPKTVMPTETSSARVTTPPVKIVR